MSYESVDKLQKALMDNVFHYAKDRKKAAGRALGTLVEIITYYLLKSWGLNDYLSIERGLAEYGNPEITHNVEYSLHPLLNKILVQIKQPTGTITSNKILSALAKSGANLQGYKATTNQLITKNGLLRNACTIAKSESTYLLANVESETEEFVTISIYEQQSKPFALFECKRVGVEEGMVKGPQTIEKAKQGAYVARTTSSLQKVRNYNGEQFGVIFSKDGTVKIGPYIELLDEVVYTGDQELLKKFILTVGIVSNHGNWFTSDNQNKELKVLAQSYDWLLFLTDQGLAEFIERFLLTTEEELMPIREAFSASYTADKKLNQFTKVKISILADIALTTYFKKNLGLIHEWFNIISPKEKNIDHLRDELFALTAKNWTDILK